MTWEARERRDDDDTTQPPQNSAANSLKKTAPPVTLARAKAGHRKEVTHFASVVAGDEVAFLSCSYRRLLATWRQDHRQEIRAHAEAVLARFSP